VSARVLLQVSADQQNGDSFNVYTQVIEVAGATVTEFFIPWLSRKYLTEPHHVFAHLRMSLLTNVSTPGGNDCPIVACIYAAAGEDVQYSYLGDDTGNIRVQDRLLTTGQVTGEPQYDPRLMFRKPFEPFHASFEMSKHQGVTAPDKFVTVADILGGYEAVKSAEFTKPLSHYADKTLTLQVNPVMQDTHHTDNTTWNILDNTNVSFKPTTRAEALAGMFKFMRGSYRYKIHTAPANTTVGAQLVLDNVKYPNHSQGDGVRDNYAPVAVFDGHTSAMATIEVPYMASTSFMPTWPSDEFTQLTKAPWVHATSSMSRVQTDTVDEMYVRFMVYGAAGDDFQLAFFHALNAPISYGVKKFPLTTTVGRSLTKK
jgi:hypothetical protein